MNQHKIKWDYPEPRKGIMGSWDKFVGPGATRAELFLMLVPSLAFSVFIILNANLNNLQWTIWQYIIAFILAFDISGGITTNSTSCAKRWYHRKGQHFRHHIGFVSIHILQIALVSIFFHSVDIVYIIKLYLALIVGSLLILLIPRYIQRSVAITATAVTILLSSYGFFPQIQGMEWFIPFLFIKIFISHLTFEEPYAKEQ